MVNIKDVARITGYSVGTVSKALNGYSDISEKTKQKIKQVADELGYKPSSFGQQLVTKKSYTVGIVFEETTGLGLAHPYFGELLTVFKEELEDSGYDILLLSKKVNPYVNTYLDHCLQKGVDGVITLSADLDHENYIKLVESDIPIVLVDLIHENKNSIATDNYTSTRKIVKYLIDNNHKKIAYTKGEVFNHVGRERFNGFLDEMKANNLEVNPKYIFDSPNYTTEEGYRISGEISDLEDKPTAVVCCADAVAIGLIDGFHNLNIEVPDEISVVGFDDIMLSKLITPKLTTIAQNKQEIGRLAVKTLIENINNREKKAENFQVEGTLIIRNSVKKL